MNEDELLFRSSTKFPRSFESTHPSVFKGWSGSNATSAHALDVQIRSYGWHFMWLVLRVDRLAFGLTAESAFLKAMRSGLSGLNERFNVAEVLRVKRSHFLGLHAAHIWLASRHIQEAASLGLMDEAVLRRPAEPSSV